MSLAGCWGRLKGWLWFYGVSRQKSNSLGVCLPDFHIGFPSLRSQAFWCFGFSAWFYPLLNLIEASTGCQKPLWSFIPSSLDQWQMHLIPLIFVLCSVHLEDPRSVLLQFLLWGTGHYPHISALNIPTTFTSLLQCALSFPVILLLLAQILLSFKSPCLISPSVLSDLSAL